MNKSAFYLFVDRQQNRWSKATPPLMVKLSGRVKAAPGKYLDWPLSLKCSYHHPANVPLYHPQWLLQWIFRLDSWCWDQPPTTEAINQEARTATRLQQLWGGRRRWQGKGRQEERKWKEEEKAQRGKTGELILPAAPVVIVNTRLWKL